MNRREFIRRSTTVAAGIASGGLSVQQLEAAVEQEKKKMPFLISLAQWSLHKALFAKKIDNLDFAKIAKQEFKINGVEYVNQFFKDKAKDVDYLKEMKKRSDDLGVKNVLIMCDGEGKLGDPDEAKRKVAVENHYKWVEAAKFLGCHSIRVNAYSDGTFEEQQDRAADGLRRLCEFAEPHKINVIVENHGGFSSNGEWLAGTIKKVNHKGAGTLPDFGNFRLGEGKEYDRYKGVAEMMPFAKGVSAKSHDFDEMGNEIHTDYRKMVEIVLKAGYKGYIGIEYEGSKIDEYEGIRKTKELLLKIRKEMMEKA